MRVQWVHPSWRDLVIEHLSQDPGARERFLSRCGLHGVLLAVSIAGGREGERQLPLLVSDPDWDALSDRIYLLVPDLDTGEQRAVLDGLDAAIKRLGQRSAKLEALGLARVVLSRLTGTWDQARSPLPVSVLEAWFALAAQLPDPPLRPPNLTATWAELFPASPPELADAEEVERFADWLALAELLPENDPYDPDDRQWRHLGNELELINQFMDSVDRASQTVTPATRGDVQRALNSIQMLLPEQAAHVAYLSNWLAHGSQPLPSSDEPKPSPGQERIGWRHFDVARVLRDL